METLDAARQFHAAAHNLGGLGELGITFSLPPTFGGGSGTFDPTLGVGPPPPPPTTTTTSNRGPSTGVIVASVANSVAQSLAAIFNRNQITGVQGQLPSGYRYDQYGRIVDQQGNVIVQQGSSQQGTGIYTYPGGVSLFGINLSWPTLAVGAVGFYLLNHPGFTKRR